ncbi:hypothetical protein D3C79_860800 [compost metagenome]
MIRPAITRLCPSLSCTVVSARRTENEGMMEVTPLIDVKGEPVCDRSDTSDTSLRLTRALPSTVGVNLTPMPNSFSSSVITGTPLVLLWATGMKILPPERKLACWPLMAMMLGSARIRTRPSSFCPSMASAPLPMRMALSNPPPPLRKLETME